MTGQRRVRRANIETVLGEWHVFVKVLPLSIHQNQCWSSLGHHRRQFVGIEPAMGCDAGPTLNRNWVGRPTSCVRGTCRPTSGDKW